MAFYRLSTLERIGAAAADDREQRPAVRGERMEMGYYRYPPGTKKQAHSHPEEQPTPGPAGVVHWPLM